MKKTLTLSLSFLMLSISTLHAQNLHMVNGNSSDFGLNYDASTGIISNLFFTFGESEGFAVNSDFTISWGIQSDINDPSAYTEIDRQVFTAGISGFSSFKINNWTSKNLNDFGDITDGDYYLVGIVDTDDDISESNESASDNGMLLASDASGTINFKSNGSLSAADVSQESALINAFPNPFQDHLSIDLETGIGTLVQIQFLDLSGKVMLSSAVNSILERLTIDTDSLVSGLYVLRIKTDSGTLTKRVLKK